MKPCNPDKPQRKITGVWIPIKIWDALDLSWMEKCVLAEIKLLEDDEQGGCFASNSYLAKQFNTSASAMAKMISNLRGSGRIKNVSFNGRMRVIKVSEPESQPLPTGKPCLNPQVIEPLPVGKPLEPCIYKENKSEKIVELSEHSSASVSVKWNEDCRKFEEEWYRLYAECCGKPYAPNYSRDRKAIKEFLASGARSEGELLELAKAAWEKPRSRKYWACNQSHYIYGFLSNVRNVELEIEPAAAIESNL